MCISSSNAKVYMCLCVWGGGEEKCFDLTYIIHHLFIIISNSHHIVLYYSLHYPLCFTFVIVFLVIYHPLFIFFKYFAIDNVIPINIQKTLTSPTLIWYWYETQFSICLCKTHVRKVKDVKHFNLNNGIRLQMDYNIFHMTNTFFYLFTWYT